MALFSKTDSFAGYKHPNPDQQSLFFEGNIRQTNTETMGGSSFLPFFKFLFASPQIYGINPVFQKREWNEAHG
jgi:hypothetical protein